MLASILMVAMVAQLPQDRVDSTTASVLALSREGRAIRLTTPAEAVRLAAQDIGFVHRLDQRFQRYIWLQENHVSHQASMSWILNTAVSHAPTIYHPVPVAGGVLLRFDLRRLAPDDVSFKRLTGILSNYYDPKFQFKPHEKVEPYVAVNGRTYNFVYGEARPSLHAGVENFLLLATLTDCKRSAKTGIPTETPIFSAPLFLVRSLSMNKANGGLYYDFRGYERKPAKGTALEAFLRRFGADINNSGELNGISRSAVFRSLVTGKPRACDFFYGRGSRPVDGPNLITITYDTQDGDTQAGQHPIRTLEKFQFRASEVIVWANRFEFALFNDKGDLQDEVPGNVAKNHEIPRPHTGTLQGAIACIECHGPSDGWQPFPNDVQRLTRARLPSGGKLRLNIFDDLLSEDSAQQTVDRLASRYSGDLDEPLRDARNKASMWAFRATGGLDYKQTASTISTIFREYVYDMVDARRALLELGHRVPSGKSPDYPEFSLAAVEFTNRVPPLPMNRFGVHPEDPIIAALRTDQPVNRPDFDATFPDVATREYAEIIRKQNQQLLNQVQAKE